MMHWSRSVVFLLGVAFSCRGDEFTLSTPSGSIKVTTEFVIDAKGHSHFSAKLINQTGFPIQRASFCVTSPSYKKGCLFTFWTSEAWPDAAELSRGPIPDNRTRLGTSEHYVSLTEIDQVRPRQPSRFDSIRSLYVEDLGGNTGAIFREHVISVIANSRRFLAVEKPDVADAVIRGRSDSLEQATRVSSAGKGRVTGSADPSLLGRTLGASASSSSTSLAEKVVIERIALRLTIPSTGEVLWAWDDTKPCMADLVGPEFSTTTKALCAIQDLTATAKK